MLMTHEDASKRLMQKHIFKPTFGTDQQKHNPDKCTSTVQLILGDIVLLKLNAFQGKRKVKDRWGNIQYKVIHQVMTDVCMYELQDQGGKIKVIHWNQLFLVASVKEDAMPLGEDMDLSDEMSNWSTLAELTPLECESESPVDTAWEVLTQHLTHGMPLGWLGGILWPLPVVALGPTERGLNAGMESSSLDDENVH